MIANELSAGKQRKPALAPVFSRLIPHLKSLPDPSVREAHQRGTTPVSHFAVHHAGIAKRKAPVLTDKGVIRGTTLHYT